MRFQNHCFCKPNAGPHSKTTVFTTVLSPYDSKTIVFASPMRNHIRSIRHALMCWQAQCRFKAQARITPALWIDLLKLLICRETVQRGFHTPTGQRLGELLLVGKYGSARIIRETGAETPKSQNYKNHARPDHYKSSNPASLPKVTCDKSSNPASLPQVTCHK